MSFLKIYAVILYGCTKGEIQLFSTQRRVMVTTSTLQTVIKMYYISILFVNIRQICVKKKNYIIIIFFTYTIIVFVKCFEKRLDSIFSF